MGEGLRGEGARPATHVAHVPAVSGQRNHTNKNAEASASRKSVTRAPPPSRRRLHRLEPRLGHQLLGAPPRRRPRPRVTVNADAAQHRPQPVRYAPRRPRLDFPDRRQLRRHRRHRRNATPKPRWRHPFSTSPPQSLAQRSSNRPTRKRQRRSGHHLEKRQSHLSNAKSQHNSRPHPTRPQGPKHQGPNKGPPKRRYAAQRNVRVGQNSESRNSEFSLLAS